MIWGKAFVLFCAIAFAAPPGEGEGRGSSRGSGRPTEERGRGGGGGSARPREDDEGGMMDREDKMGGGGMGEREPPTDEQRALMKSLQGKSAEEIEEMMLQMSDEEQEFVKKMMARREQGSGMGKAGKGGDDREMGEGGMGKGGEGMEDMELTEAQMKMLEDMKDMEREEKGEYMKGLDEADRKALMAAMKRRMGGGDDREGGMGGDDRMGGDDDGKMGMMKGKMDKGSMMKEHDPIDLCMFTVDDEQCEAVQGCRVMSMEDYCKLRMKVMGMEDKMEGGKGGQGGEKPCRGENCRRRLQDEKKTRGGRTKPGQGGEDDKPGMGDDKPGTEEGDYDYSDDKEYKNMCVSACYGVEVADCSGDCMVHKMMMDKGGMDKDGEHGGKDGEQGGKKGGDGGKKGGKGQDGRRRLEEAEDKPMGRGDKKKLDWENMTDEEKEAAKKKMGENRGKGGEGKKGEGEKMMDMDDLDLSDDQKEFFKMMAMKTDEERSAYMETATDAEKEMHDAIMKKMKMKHMEDMGMTPAMMALAEQMEGMTEAEKEEFYMNASDDDKALLMKMHMMYEKKEGGKMEGGRGDKSDKMINPDELGLTEDQKAFYMRMAKMSEEDRNAYLETEATDDEKAMAELIMQKMDDWHMDKMGMTPAMKALAKQMDGMSDEEMTAFYMAASDEDKKLMEEMDRIYNAYEAGKQEGGDKKPMMMEYCGPKVQEKIETGLEVTVTLYTDEECTEMLEVRSYDDWKGEHGHGDDDMDCEECDRRRLQDNKKENRKKKGGKTEEEGEDDQPEMPEGMEAFHKKMMAMTAEERQDYLENDASDEEKEWARMIREKMGEKKGEKMGEEGEKSGKGEKGEHDEMMTAEELGLTGEHKAFYERMAAMSDADREAYLKNEASADEKEMADMIMKKMMKKHMEKEFGPGMTDEMIALAQQMEGMSDEETMEFYNNASPEDKKLMERMHEMMEKKKGGKDGMGEKMEMSEDMKALKAKLDAMESDEARKAYMENEATDDEKELMRQMRENMSKMHKMKGNERQSKRVRENPSKRIIPVVDEQDAPKCSFDAMSDRMRGRFRKTTCTDANVLGMEMFDDVACTKPSEMETPMKLIFRNVCTPMPMRMHGDKEGEQDGKSGGKKGGKGGKQGGRRRLEQHGDHSGEEKGFFNELMSMGEGMMESKCNAGSTNSLTDFLQGMMCDEEDDMMENMDNEMDKMTKNERKKAERKGEQPTADGENMCDGLDEEACKKAMGKGCRLKSKVCYKSDAPEGERNLFVKYDWQYLMKDGELTAEEFCFSETPTMPDDPVTEFTKITTVDEYSIHCLTLGECEGLCQTKKGDCVPKKNIMNSKKMEVKCSKIKEPENCAMFDGCKSGEKKGEFKCSGSQKLE